MLWEEPLQTAEGNVLVWYGAGATLTEAPKAPQNVELLRRDITVGPATCGWLNGDPTAPWVIVGDVATPTCFWNTDDKIVNGWVTCLDYGDARTLGSLPTQSCLSASPYCASVFFPSGFQAHGKCNSMPDVTFNIELAFTGQTAPVDLPIYTGLNGISTGVAYPTITGTSTSIISTSSTFPGSGATLISSLQGTSLSGAAGTSTSTPSSSSKADSSTPIGAIIGAVIGGIALICATVIILFWVHRRKRRGGTVEEYSSNGQIMPKNGQNSREYGPRRHELGQGYIPSPTSPQNLPELGDQPYQFHGTIRGNLTKHELDVK